MIRVYKKYIVQWTMYKGASQKGKSCGLSWSQSASPFVILSLRSFTEVMKMMKMGSAAGMIHNQDVCVGWKWVCDLTECLRVSAIILILLWIWFKKGLSAFRWFYWFWMTIFVSFRWRFRGGICFFFKF